MAQDGLLAQAVHYLEAYAMEVGLLINFGSRSLQFKRVSKPNRTYHPAENQPAKTVR